MRLLVIIIALAITTVSTTSAAPMILTASGYGDNGELLLDSQNAPIDNAIQNPSPYDFVAIGDLNVQNISLLNFDFIQFYDSLGDTYYNYVTLAFVTDTGQSETVEDLTVTFSDFTFSGGTNLVIANAVSDSTFDLTGFTAYVDNQDLVLEFDDYFVPGEGVTIDVYFDILEDTDPNASVVPVPAAAPMALLGLGVLALARRFRRKKS